MNLPHIHTQRQVMADGHFFKWSYYGRCGDGEKKLFSDRDLLPIYYRWLHDDDDLRTTHTENRDHH